jgi:adenylosuccinate lyase
LVVGRYHAENLLNTQVKGAAHTLGDMPAEGAEATRQVAIELLACASPSSTSWQASRAAAHSSSNSCCEEL